MGLTGFCFADGCYTITLLFASTETLCSPLHTYSLLGLQRASRY
ncbi:hypothetical protein PPEP_a3373 [Pseudoalteromonas peptidolytica F12-50-A1]|uniref:Uncharacterized protein n=1 Tax=Pseudoalteromonas peptidolytica F12-50-A1 TaxID=1315280 RepID=A0A8I0T3A1_9GAMM|nr:hypothetical protein [Pseudoalteromonas peptidolytica F12-50-A1]